MTPQLAHQADLADKALAASERAKAKAKARGPRPTPAATATSACH